MQMLKKLTLGIALMLTSTLSFAQTNNEDTPSGKQGGVYFGGLIDNNNAGMNFSVACKLGAIPGSFVCGLDMWNPMKDDKGTRWGCFAGYQYRHWMLDKMFVEGRIALNIYDVEPSPVFRTFSAFK